MNEHTTKIDINVSGKYFTCCCSLYEKESVLSITRIHFYENLYFKNKKHYTHLSAKMRKCFVDRTTVDDHDGFIFGWELSKNLKIPVQMYSNPISIYKTIQNFIQETEEYIESTKVDKDTLVINSQYTYDRIIYIYLGKTVTGGSCILYCFRVLGDEKIELFNESYLESFNLKLI